MTRPTVASARRRSRLGGLSLASRVREMRVVGPGGASAASVAGGVAGHGQAGAPGRSRTSLRGSRPRSSSRSAPPADLDRAVEADRQGIGGVPPLERRDRAEQPIPRRVGPHRWRNVRPSGCSTPRFKWSLRPSGGPQRARVPDAGGNAIRTAEGVRLRRRFRRSADPDLPVLVIFGIAATGSSGKATPVSGPRWRSRSRSC